MSLFNKIPFILSDYGHLGIKVGLGCKIKVNCPHVGSGPARGVPSVAFFKGSNHVVVRVLEKITKNSERLGIKVRPGIEPDIFHLPILRAEMFSHWWGHLGITVSHEASYNASLVYGMHQIIGF